MKRNNIRKSLVWILTIAMVLSLSLGVFFVRGEDTTSQDDSTTESEQVANETSANEETPEYGEEEEPYAPDVYTVRFVTNGGSGVNSQHIHIGDCATRPTNPVKAGYVFQGWYIDEALTIPYDFNTPVTNHITLHAKWNGTSYYISYELDGGALTVQNPNSYTVDTETFTLHNPSKEGYTFTGWTGTGLSDKTTTVTIAKGSSGNRSYTAHYSANSYVIKYDAAGGTGSMSDQPMTYGTSAHLKANTFSRTDYDFAGWSLINGGTVKFADEEIVSNLVKENGGSITLHAVWSEKERIVVFYRSSNTDWGDVTNPSDNWVSGSTIGAIGSEAIANTGYHFVKWTTKNGSAIDSAEATITGNKILPTEAATAETTYIAHFAPNTDTAYKVKYYRQMITGGYELFKEENASGTTGELVTADIINVGNGFFHNENAPGSKTSGVINADGSLELSVYYDREKYTVIWNNDDGTEIYRQLDVPYGSIPTFESSTPTKEATDEFSFEFAGWTPAFAPVTEDVTYTAVYTRTPLVYSLDFDTDGGSVVSSQDIEYGGNATPPDDPTKEGYDFGGWFADRNFEEEFDFDKPITENTTAYAKWEPTTYHIEYQLFGGLLPLGSTNPTTYTIEDDDIVLVNPIKPGFAFLGWSGTEVIDMSQNVTIPSGSTGDRVYMATWLGEILGPGTDDEITPPADPTPEPPPGEDIEIPPTDDDPNNDNTNPDAGGGTTPDNNTPGNGGGTTPDNDKPDNNNGSGTDNQPDNNTGSGDNNKPDNGNKPGDNNGDGDNNKPENNNSAGNNNSGNGNNSGNNNGSSSQSGSTTKPQTTVKPTKTPSATTITKSSPTGDTNYANEFFIFVIVVAASVVVGMLLRRHETK